MEIGVVSALVLVDMHRNYQNVMRSTEGPNFYVQKKKDGVATNHETEKSPRIYPQKVRAGLHALLEINRRIDSHI